MTELKSYELPELEALAERIKAEIAKREEEEQQQARRALEEAQAAARAAAEKAAQEAAQEAAEAERKAQEEAEQAARAREAESRIRYMHPSNRALTWSGVGPTPDWVHAWLVTGGTLYALEIAAEKLAPRPIPESLRPR
ncbi:H-NS family nucleoid-associated regulatory protein [Zoogloea sp.]|jgi:DNA-binding protein H-NS|uniref:H-NS family nucleoid-associated regulatory protein n=1 Tax=Zoogloea sp. TaxID=49181 RepID=UPI0035B236C0